MAKRLKNWPSRLQATIEAARHHPFTWGEHDCCLWAASAVLACTGEDPAAAFRGTYADAMSAARLIGQLGGMEVIGALGGPEISPRFATAGDVGLVELADRVVLAVHSGQVWLAAGTHGLEPCVRMPVLKAWKVGGSHG